MSGTPALGGLVDVQGRDSRVQQPSWQELHGLTRYQ